ncbi:MAG: glycosyltransferase family 39 protein [Chloroflexi bacterium]|nr:glycosyltransferase family 39 protein [Chloroflexota bacterium]
MPNPLYKQNGINNIGVRNALILILILLVLGSPTLAYPFGRDQAEYAWVAVSAMRGRLSYSDVFNVKPPLTHLTHQTALLLFGCNMLSIRILDLLWQGWTAWLIYRIALKLEQPHHAGILAAVLYLFSYYRMDFWMTAQTDGFLSLPLAAGVFFFLQAHHSKQRWLSIASGAALGLAVLYKYPIGILIIFLALLELLWSRKDGWLPVFWMGVGFLLPVIIAVFGMAARGNLTDFLWIQSIFIPRYSMISTQNVGVWAALGLGLLHVILPVSPGWASLLGLYGFLGKADAARFRARMVILLWWVSALIHFLAQGKNYDYHLLPIYAPLALMLGESFTGFIRSRSAPRFAFGALGALLMAIPFLGEDFPQKYTRLWDVAAGNTFLHAVYGDAEFDRDGVDRDFSSRANLEAAAYFSTHADQDESIFIWGFEPGVYFLSQRQNATRFIYNFPLYGPNADPVLRAEFVRDLRQQRPVYIAIVRNDGMFQVTASQEDSWEAFNSFAEFRQFVFENYALETTIEDFEIYRLNE